MTKRKYALFHIVTDNGTTEFETSYINSLATFAKYESATLYGQPTDESLPLTIVKSK